MNAKELAAGTLIGVVLGAGGTKITSDMEKVSLKTFGPDRVWEQSYNGTDGSDPNKVYYVSHKHSDGTEAAKIIIPKSMVKE